MGTNSTQPIPATANPPGLDAYVSWRDGVDRQLRLSRPDVRPEDVDPAGAYAYFRRNFSPRDFVSLEDLPLVDVRRSNTIRNSPRPEAIALSIGLYLARITAGAAFFAWALRTLQIDGSAGPFITALVAIALLDACLGIVLWNMVRERRRVETSIAWVGAALLLSLVLATYPASIYFLALTSR
jgi:hypothetical protein